ncbi:MAG: uroporphyrinogen-III synthase [Longimicrobiales bacterium]
MLSDRRSLSGRRIVITRARAQAEEMARQLTELGAEVIFCPAIRIADPQNASPFQHAVATLDRFDWVILTSVNGVRAILAELERQGSGAHALAQRRVACVGPTTAAALRHSGIIAQAMPDQFVGAEIATVLAHRIQAGEQRILLARGAGGNPALPERLRALGAQVTEVEAYRSLPDLEQLEQVRARLRERTIDVITFTSPSTVTYFEAGVGVLPPEVVLAAIGPVTAHRMRELGLIPAVVAPDHTVAGLVQALSSHFANRGDGIGGH